MTSLFQRARRSPLTAIATVTAVSNLLLYRQVASRHLGLVAGIVFLTSVATLAWLAFEFFAQRLRLQRETARNVRTLIVATTAVLLVLELFLRFGLGKYSSYPERTGQGGYFSYYWYEWSSWVPVHRAGRYDVANSEFRYSHTINSLGLVEREVPARTDSNEVRILAIGDSFTEGLGTTFDSSYVRVMERNLRERFPGRHITAINAGIAGSDPFFEYKLLEQLTSLDPDLVIVATNFSDIFDIQVRGGMDRFRPDGTAVSTTQAPWWEWLYGVSYINRHIVHDVLGYDYRFVKNNRREEVEANTGALLVEAVDSMAALAQDSGFALLVVTHPNIWDIRNGHLERPLEILNNAIAGRDDIHSFDLSDYFRETGIINPDNADRYYWEVDGHHNGLGYEAMGDAITEAVLRMRVIE